jgi:catechol 2,3-dioxygenase-like lactoylglutathione lyase family enzyme
LPFKTRELRNKTRGIWLWKSWPFGSLKPSVFEGVDGVTLEGLTLHVSDVNRSVEFYKKVPGAELLMHFGEQFAMFKFGEGRLGLLRAVKPGFHIELGTEKRLDAMYEAVLAAGIEPESPPTDRSWGRRDFLVRDPDGNLLEFD